MSDIPGTLEIQLAGGRVTIVSQEDYAALSAIYWYVSSSGYVTNRRTYRDPPTLRMHREIFRLHGVDIPSGMEVDHINNNRLDNRFENLRLCDRTHNLANRPYTNRTGFRGVTKRVDGGYVGYRGRVTFKGKGHLTRSFHTPEEAAVARDELATQLFGEFATLNFSQE